MPSTCSIYLNCDARPLAFVIECLYRANVPQSDIRDLGFEIARVEINKSATVRHEITLYPSDAFLSFVATAISEPE